MGSLGCNQTLYLEATSSAGVNQPSSRLDSSSPPLWDKQVEDTLQISQRVSRVGWPNPGGECDA